MSAWRVAVGILAVFLTVGIARAAEYTDAEILAAIYQAEGGARAQYLYGIRSVKYKNAQEARAICLRTIRNNRARYRKYLDGTRTRKGGEFFRAVSYADFLEFLGNRYCPPGLGGVNRYWLRNVRKILERQTGRGK
jgi:hypothetical protein